MAKFYFPFTPEDDLYDLWEERFFEQKQYFLTHTPLRVVWESKIKRLKKTYEAYLLLTDQPYNPIEAKINTEESIFSEDFIDSFNTFHTLRNQQKTKVLYAQTMDQLVQAVEEWLTTENRFATYWSHPLSEEDEIQAIRSQEIDPMDLLKELKTIKEELNISTLAELKKNYKNLPENVRKEVKRLTLLANK